MLSYELTHEMVKNDFMDFYKADKFYSQTKIYCDKHFQSATQLTMQAFAWKQCYSMTEVEDFIHGLNHVFFNAAVAGAIEKNYEKEGDK